MKLRERVAEVTRAVSDLAPRERLAVLNDAAAKACRGDAFERCPGCNGVKRTALDAARERTW